MADLKAELAKAKEAAQEAQAATDATRKKFYDLGVQEIEARLTNKLAEVCRDYCLEVWTNALNVAKVPVNSEWRKTENVYYPTDIREVPTALPSLIAPALTSSKQPFIT